MSIFRANVDYKLLRHVEFIEHQLFKGGMPRHQERRQSILRDDVGTTRSTQNKGHLNHILIPTVETEDDC